MVRGADRVSAGLLLGFTLVSWSFVGGANMSGMLGFRTKIPLLVCNPYFQKHLYELQQLAHTSVHASYISNKPFRCSLCLPLQQYSPYS